MSEGGTPAYELLIDTIGAVHPYATAMPYLITGGTDARYFRAISDGVFGFMPCVRAESDVRRAHGNDERILMTSYIDGIGFYARLMKFAGMWH